MSNYKIRVNSKAESKEAQELFFELGYEKGACSTGGYPALIIATPESRFQKTPYSSRATSLNHEVHSQYKEITLPELRDLVVLKRNDVGDANYIRPRDGKEYFKSSQNNFYHMLDSEWIMSTWENGQLEPGTYSYIGTVRPEHVSDFMIEIPKGCNIITCEERKCGLVYFHWKSLDSDEFFLKDEKIWSNNFDETLSDFIEKSEGEVKIIWSRHTHPEELPFIDDEPLQSLNDQYAEIEKVRQSHRTASVIADSALRHIRERAETYDQPTGERTAAKTAKAFNAITGKDITESEVWLLLQLLKDVRQWSREDYHQDSAEDCIAYAALKAESLEGGE